VSDDITDLQIALEGQYEVLTRLGQGGMATVYMARDVRTPRDVAVKVIREELAAAVSTERFLQEIRITASLSHPNIRPLLDSGVAHDRPYYVMPFMQGQTLGERLEEEIGLGLEECLRIAGELAKALSYAHDNGVIHRDVKPSNVFLPDGHAVLSDFGIALAANTADRAVLTESGFMIGTAEYMSPEQGSDRKAIDGRSDIYSLGCVLFAMLTGQPPYMGRSWWAIVAKHVQGPLPSAAILRPDLPIEVEEIVERCLAKTPGDRFQSASDLSDAIESARAVCEAGRSRGTALTTRREPRRRLIKRTLAATAFLGLGALIFAPLIVGPSLDLNENRVVVFPLADRGVDAVGDGTSTAMMIINALTHADPLRALDGWQRLDVAQRGDPGLLTQRDARRISIADGARHFITGGVASIGDSITVLLVLHDAEIDAVVHQAAATMAISEATADQVALRAMVELLPALLDPGRDVDLSFLFERNPSAIALWIQGDQAYREARFSTALTLYVNAVEQDSLLALAALKGAKTASWVERLEVAGELIAVARAAESTMPMRHQRLARGLEAYLEGRADEAVEEITAALDADPEWSDAWMMLGEVYQHLLPSDLGEGDLAERAFQESRTLDPTFVQPLVHLSEYAIRAGDLTSARENVALFREKGAEGSSRIQAVSLMLRCVEAGIDRQGWRSQARSDISAVLEAAQQLAVAGRHVECAEEAFQSVIEADGVERNLRWAATMGLQGILIAQGRDDEAGVVLDEAQAAGISDALFMPMIDLWAGADMYERAERVDSLANALWGEELEGVGPLTLWVLAIWEAQAGDTIALSRVSLRAQAVHEERGDGASAVVADAVRGHLSLATGDTTSAMEIWSGLRSVGTARHLFTALPEPLVVERLVMAELLLSRGDAEAAYWSASAIDHPQPLVFAAFLAKSLEIRWQAASALGGSMWAQRADNARGRLEGLGRSDLLAEN
jgi:tetratricopeptide (TPR) repeat protein